MKKIVFATLVFLLFGLFSVDVFANCDSGMSIQDFFANCVNVEGYDFTPQLQPDGRWSNLDARKEFAKNVLDINYDGSGNQNPQLMAAFNGDTSSQYYSSVSNPVVSYEITTSSGTQTVSSAGQQDELGGGSGAKTISVDPVSDEIDPGDFVEEPSGSPAPPPAPAASSGTSVAIDDMNVVNDAGDAVLIQNDGSWAYLDGSSGVVLYYDAETGNHYRTNVDGTGEPQIVTDERVHEQFRGMTFAYEDQFPPEEPVTPPEVPATPSEEPVTPPTTSVTNPTVVDYVEDYPNIEGVETAGPNHHVLTLGDGSVVVIDTTTGKEVTVTEENINTMCSTPECIQRLGVVANPSDPWAIRLADCNNDQTCIANVIAQRDIEEQTSTVAPTGWEARAAACDGDEACLKALVEELSPTVDDDVQGEVYDEIPPPVPPSLPDGTLVPSAFEGHENVFHYTGNDGSTRTLVRNSEGVFVDPRTGQEFEADSDGKLTERDISDEQRRENRKFNSEARKAARAEERARLQHEARNSPFMEGAENWLSVSRNIGRLLGHFGVDVDGFGWRSNYEDWRREKLQNPNIFQAFAFGSDAWSEICYQSSVGNFLWIDVGLDDVDMDLTRRCLTNACITMSAEYINHSYDGTTVLASEVYTYKLNLFIEPPVCPDNKIIEHEDGKKGCEEYWQFRVWLGDSNDLTQHEVFVEPLNVHFSQPYSRVGQRTIFLQFSEFYDRFTLETTHGDPRSLIDGYQLSGDNNFVYPIIESGINLDGPDSVPGTSPSASGGGSGGTTTDPELNT